jgi:hypothetical protein
MAAAAVARRPSKQQIGQQRGAEGMSTERHLPPDDDDVVGALGISVNEQRRILAAYEQWESTQNERPREHEPPTMTAAELLARDRKIRERAGTSHAPDSKGDHTPQRRHDPELCGLEPELSCPACRELFHEPRAQGPLLEEDRHEQAENLRPYLAKLIREILAVELPAALDVLRPKGGHRAGNSR